MINKAFIIYDKTPKSLKIRQILVKKILSTSLKKAKILIVLGGDGFMLQSLKKYYKHKKPFYGINTGSYGFLMNKFQSNRFLLNLNSSKLITIYPLKMLAKTLDTTKKAIAINEVSVLRQSKQAANICVFNRKKKLIKKLISDGLLVSTPAGSTAYNLSVHGPILNLDSKKIAVTPISPFRPRRWRGCILSENSKIVIKNLDMNKRPVSAVADNYEVRNIRSLIIQIEKKIKFNLMYNRNSSLQKKIKIEQLRRETSIS